MRAPLSCRALIRIASWIVPSRGRSAWLACRAAELYGWWYLVERGEVLRDSGAALCRRAFAGAFSERFGDSDPLRFVRSPMFVPIAAAASLVALALFSHGFSVTRNVLAIAFDMQDHPRPGQYDFRGDRIFIYLAPILLAVATGAAALGLGCLTLRGRGWRYWGFLAGKALAVAILLPLLWVEAGTAFRSLLTGGWRILAGVISAAVLIIATGRAMIWCVADQRRRCRACLRRLVLPVSVGSYASLFEPSATEMLCEQGHGALSLSDTETDVQDRWTRLDDSWKALFR